MNTAFLFDIDGCLTLPRHNISVLDIDLLDAIYQMNNPVALVTGRSDGWLRQKYAEFDRIKFLQLPTYIEFGLAYLREGKLGFQEDGVNFQNIRKDFIRTMADYCKQQEVYFEAEIWYDDYPIHGSLWVENKHIQLSIAENTDCPTVQVHKLVDEAWKESMHQARVLHHHLGVDVIPNGWTKAKATQHFIQNLNEQDYQWFVFGDNQSDQEMMKGLTDVEFISTKKDASLAVRKKLQELDIRMIDTAIE